MKDVKRRYRHDAAGGAEDRDVSSTLLGLNQALHQHGEGAGEKIKDPEFPPTVHPFQFASEHPEHEHVSADVPDAGLGMNKAGGNQPPEFRKAQVAVDDADAGGGHPLTDS